MALKRHSTGHTKEIRSKLIVLVARACFGTLDDYGTDTPCVLFSKLTADSPWVFRGIRAAAQRGHLASVFAVDRCRRE